MLSKIFAGSTGLASRLAKALGGEATLKIAWDGAGDPRDRELRPVPCAWEREEASEGASQIPGGRTWDGSLVANGSRRRESRAICLVPAASLDAPPRVGADLISLDAIDYSVEKVETVRAGGSRVLYRLTCARV
ncbi:MAG: hypothetical protein IJM30_04235 [Thermoguttaceae bacterium]|nr:hypothetical protein [Thermoguttaceae bacterium]